MPSLIKFLNQDLTPNLISCFLRLSMHKLLAKPVAESIRSEVFKRSQKFTQTFGRPPKLSVILVGDDPGSVIYTQKKGEMAVQLGMSHETFHFPADISPAEVKRAVDSLNLNPLVDGILIQRPLPPQFNEKDVLYWVSPEKDVDAFHPVHAGELLLGLPTLMPCTPAGIMELLKFYQIDPTGKVSCIIGRSSIVGKPMASLLLNASSTIIHCHRKTPQMRELSKQADILIVAAGQRALIDSSYVKKGATVIDVGIHRLPSGGVTGDVQFDDVAQVASAITPVPGGVGPMTIAMLMKNTIQAAELRQAQAKH